MILLHRQNAGTSLTGTFEVWAFKRRLRSSVNSTTSRKSLTGESMNKGIFRAYKYAHIHPRREIKRKTEGKRERGRIKSGSTFAKKCWSGFLINTDKMQGNYSDKELLLLTFATTRHEISGHIFTVVKTAGQDEIIIVSLHNQANARFSLQIYMNIRNWGLGF